MSADAQYGAVLLIGFGGPASARRDSPVPRPRDRRDGRCRASATRKSCIITKPSADVRPSTKSPMRQAAALRARLAGAGRRSSGGARDAQLRRLARRHAARARAGGVRRALGFVLAAHRCEASWDRYQRTSQRRANGWPRRARGRIPRRLARASAVHRGRGRPRRRRARAPRTRRCAIAHELIFTAHSIPAAMAAAAPYRRAIERIGTPGRGAPWTAAMDARLSEPQRQPARSVARARHVRRTAQASGARRSVVAPIGFSATTSRCFTISTSRPRAWRARRASRWCGRRPSATIRVSSR